MTQGLHLGNGPDAAEMLLGSWDRLGDRTCERRPSLMPRFLRRFLCDHPHSVDESYFQHALSFGWHMGRGAVACALHAACRFVHVRTGSQTVVRLHERMVLNRRRQRVDEMRSLNPADSV